MVMREVIVFFNEERVILTRVQVLAPNPMPIPMPPVLFAKRQRGIFRSHRSARTRLG